MTTQNRNPIAQEALYSSGLRHPLLDTTNGEPWASAHGSVSITSTRCLTRGMPDARYA